MPNVRMFRAAIAFAMVAICAPHSLAQDAPDPDQVRQIAEEAFVYGYPMVVGYGVLYEYAVNTSSDQYKAPFNQIYNTAHVYSPQDTAVVTPNSDTPYSFVWADLRAEPLVVSVPDVEQGRYYAVQLTDMYTFNYGYFGSRTTGNTAGTYLIAGPDWTGESPAGIDGVFHCETDFSLVLFRTQLFGADDIDKVKEIQAGYRVQPLSTHLNQPAPPPAAEIDWPAFSKEQAAGDPFSYLNFVLQFCRPVGPAAGEQALRDRFATIGIEAGRPFSLDALAAEQKQAFAAGMQSGVQKIQQRVANIGRSENGWRLGSAAGDREFYHGDWELRAAGAMAGIYGNSQAEAFYPFVTTDSAGNKPDGSTNRYTMTFAADALPPVNAFWSVTIYDAKTQLLIDNPINRYLINSPMLDAMQRNADGSLTIHIQKDSPGADRESNWLPAPDGPIFLVMRLYWPKEEAVNGTWSPPPVIPTANAAVPPDDEVGARSGDKSLETVVRTDERYGDDGLFHGPRGWVYWNDLADPRPIQNPNLWPDMQSTYFIGRLQMPAGSTLTLQGQYPQARYFQLALYKADQGTFVSIGEALSGREITPDAGSSNPFVVGADRLVEQRRFTIDIAARNVPDDASQRETNTLYVGDDGGVIQAVMRIYLSDQGRDGAGWGSAAAPTAEAGFPTYTATLADGTQLSADEVVQQLSRPIESTSQPLTADQWVALVNNPDNDPSLDPATAPARAQPQWEKYWGIPYSILGAFKTPEAREQISFGGAIDGGGDPTTQYFLTHLSRRFGTVYVMRGKMPTFPNTYVGADGNGLEVMPDAQVQYWSLVSCEAAPSGQIVDGLTDMQVPLDEDRNYTIVYSRREDRPRNATRENGVAWIEWSPRGEGLVDPRNREDFGMLMLRIMATNPTWTERPDNVTRPGMESAVMGPYLPRGEYTDKATFEATFTH